MAANLPERKDKRRIREQARSYKISSKPRIVGAAIAQGRAGAANLLKRQVSLTIRKQARAFRRLRGNGAGKKGGAKARGLEQCFEGFE